jgi:DNA-binding transcriptional LysR family regulator
VRSADIVLFREGLHWVKSRDLPMPNQDAIPFLSFDDQCFYRQWALEVGQGGGAYLDTVFECSSAAGIVTAVNARMGIALLSDRYISGDMEIIRERLPAPPALAYVVRRSRKTRNPALDSLIAEVEAEVSRCGGLALAS